MNIQAEKDNHLSFKVFFPYYYLLCFLCLPGFLASQYSEQWKLIAPESIEVNSSFQITFSLENQKGENFQLTAIKGARILSGPSTVSQYSIVNGKQNSKQSFSYTLFATDVGDITIPSAMITVNGQVLKTKAKTLKVAEASSLQDIKENFELRVEISNDRVYPGEQITLDYVVYYSAGFNLADIKEDLNYNGFFTQKINQPSGQKNIKVLNGKEYFYVIVKRIAIWPQKSGEYNLGRLTAGIEIPKDQGSSGFGFFSRINSEYKILTSNEVKISVEALPEYHLINFTGITGNYESGAELMDKELTADDTGVLRLKFKFYSYDGFFQLPELKMENVELFPPKVILEERFLECDKILFYKELEYLFQPLNEGALSLKPSIAYFNTEIGDYKDMDFEDNMLQIRPSQGLVNGTVDHSQKDRKKILSHLIWGGGLMAFILLIFAGVRRYKIKSHNSIENLSLNAETATGMLIKLERNKDVWSPRDFDKKAYETLQVLLFGELTQSRYIERDKMLQKVEEYKLEKEAEVLKNLHVVLDQYEKSGFAGIATDKSITLVNLQNFIENIKLKNRKTT
jgi:hypothetical protein